jgi:O-antigen/teichoic acid export membrane protein
MQLFYNTTKGAYYVKIMAIPSFISYFEGVFVSLLIATKNEKRLVAITITTNILHLILMYILVSVPQINALGLVISISVLTSTTPIILCYLASKKTKIKINLKLASILVLIYILLVIFIPLLH